MLPFHAAHVALSDPRGVALRLEAPYGLAWQAIARALLDPSSVPRDLRQAVAAYAPRDRVRWWTDAPFSGLQTNLVIQEAPGVERDHDARTLLAIAAMSPHAWTWPTLIDHWDSIYATDGQRSPHLEWVRPHVCQGLVHLASSETMGWWLDHHPALRDDPHDAQAQNARHGLVRAWWRGLAHRMGTGRSDNVVVDGTLPPQPVWDVFDALRDRGLARFEDWSHLRNLKRTLPGPGGNLNADRASPCIMTPIEAVTGLRGSENVLDEWLARGGDPNLSNPYSGVTLVQRALQCTTPTNLQRLIDAGARLDGAAGAWARGNEHGRQAGVLGYPWNGSSHRFPTRVHEVRVDPPDPWWDDHASPGPRSRTVEREETHLGLDLVLRWCSTHHLALQLQNDVGVKDVWNAGAWQAWLDRRELRAALAPDAPTPGGASDGPTRRRL